MVESTNKQPESEVIMKNTTLKSLFKPDVDGIQDKNVTRFMTAIRMVTNKKGDKPGTLYRKLQKPDGKKITKSDLIDIPKKPLTINYQGKLKQIPVRQLYLKALAEQVEVPDKPTDDNLLQSTPYKYIQEEADVKSNATDKETKKNAKTQAKEDAEKAKREAEQAEIAKTQQEKQQVQAEIAKAKKDKEDAEIEKQKVEDEIAKAKKDKEDAELEKQKMEDEVAKIKLDKEQAQQKIQQQEAELAKSNQLLAEKTKQAQETDAQNKQKQADLDEQQKQFAGLNEQQKQIEQQRIKILNNLAIQIKSKIDTQYVNEKYDPRGQWKDILDPINAIQPNKQTIEQYRANLQKINDSQKSRLGIGIITGQYSSQVNKIQEYLQQLIPKKDIIDIGRKLESILLAPEDVQKYEKQANQVNQQYKSDLTTFRKIIVQIPDIISGKQLYESGNQRDKRGTWDQVLGPFTKTEQKLIRDKVQELGNDFNEWFMIEYGNGDDEKVLNYYKTYKPVDEETLKDEDSKFSKKQGITMGDIPTVFSQLGDQSFADATDVEQSTVDMLELKKNNNTKFADKLNAQIQEEQYKTLQNLEYDAQSYAGTEQTQYVDMIQALKQTDTQSDISKQQSQFINMTEELKQSDDQQQQQVQMVESINTKKTTKKTKPQSDKEYSEKPYPGRKPTKKQQDEAKARARARGDVPREDQGYKSDNVMPLKQQLKDKGLDKYTIMAILYVSSKIKDPDAKLALFNQIDRLTVQQLKTKYEKYETIAQAEKNAIKQEVAQFVALKDKFMKDLLVKKQRK